MTFSPTARHRWLREEWSRTFPTPQYPEEPMAVAAPGPRAAPSATADQTLMGFRNAHRRPDLEPRREAWEAWAAAAVAAPAPARPARIAPVQLLISCLKKIHRLRSHFLTTAQLSSSFKSITPSTQTGV